MHYEKCQREHQDILSSSLALKDFYTASSREPILTRIGRTPNVVASNTSPDGVMKSCRTIAVVGASKSPEKEAHSVPLYLKERGYTIIPVNPTADSIFGERAYPTLADVPLDVASKVDVVEVFRPSEELPQVANQVIELKRRTGRQVVFWAQTGLESEEAKRKLEAEAVPYVMDACMRVVHQIYVAGKR